jgi:chemotaxis methyl-accepting protein methylase
MHSVAVQLIADRLAIATGMDPRSLDASRLQWIIDARCGALQLPDSLSYAAYLQAVTEELDTLIDEVVVQETRFFRDPAVFAHLRTILPKLAATFPGTIRILSAPCGTGQEAYSLAATIEQAGLPLSRFQIDAFDISVSALAFARNGIYPEQALRPLTEEQQRSVAQHEHNHWKIHPTLRQRVHFDRRNLASPSALTSPMTTESGAPGPDSRARVSRESEDSARYHLILCRNLFIYLHPEARATLAQSLAGALIPGGMLVLGSADRVEELSLLFAPLRPASSFAFTHRSSTPSQETKPTIQSRRKTLPSTATSTRTPKPASRSTAIEAPLISKVSATTALDLYNRALQHQQLGNLRSAERRCRQALYLAPNFIPALELLQSLWHQQPNQRLRHALTARIFRTREAQTKELMP